MQEACKKGSLMTTSGVAEGNLQMMSGCNTPVSELDATDSQVDMSGSSSTGAEHCAVHGDVSKVSPSASSFIDSAASSVGDFPVACSSTARGSPSKKFRTTIQRLQSKVASCRRTITRLQKKQSKLPPSISKALNIIRPCVTEEVFKLLCTHVRLQQGQRQALPCLAQEACLAFDFSWTTSVPFFGTNFLSAYTAVSERVVK